MQNLKEIPDKVKEAMQYKQHYEISQKMLNALQHNNPILKTISTYSFEATLWTFGVRDARETELKQS